MGSPLELVPIRKSAFLCCRTRARARGHSQDKRGVAACRNPTSAQPALPSAAATARRAVRQLGKAYGLGAESGLMRVLSMLAAEPHWGPEIRLAGKKPERVRGSEIPVGS